MDILSTKQAAELLGMSHNSLSVSLSRSEVARRKFRATKLGKIWVLERGAVEHQVRIKANRAARKAAKESGGGESAK